MKTMEIMREPTSFRWFLGRLLEDQDEIDDTLVCMDLMGLPFVREYVQERMTRSKWKIVEEEGLVNLVRYMLPVVDMDVAVEAAREAAEREITAEAKAAFWKRIRSMKNTGLAITAGVSDMAWAAVYPKERDRERMLAQAELTITGFPGWHGQWQWPARKEFYDTAMTMLRIESKEAAPPPVELNLEWLLPSPKLLRKDILCR